MVHTHTYTHKVSCLRLPAQNKSIIEVYGDDKEVQVPVSVSVPVLVPVAVAIHTDY